MTGFEGVSPTHPCPQDGGVERLPKATRCRPGPCSMPGTAHGSHQERGSWPGGVSGGRGQVFEEELCHPELLQSPEGEEAALRLQWPGPARTPHPQRTFLAPLWGAHGEDAERQRFLWALPLPDAWMFPVWAPAVSPPAHLCGSQDGNGFSQ